MNGIRRRDVISKSQEYREFLFDQYTFGAGTFHDTGFYSQHSIIPNLYNNTDGIRLKGVSGYAPGLASWADQEYWRYTIDLTGYNYIKFYGLKVANHGMIRLGVFEKGTWNELELFIVGYADLDNNWHSYELDISQFNGECDIAFFGGYWDSSGNRNSETKYANVRLTS